MYRVVHILYLPGADCSHDPLPTSHFCLLKCFVFIEPTFAHSNAHQPLKMGDVRGYRSAWRASVHSRIGGTRPHYWLHKEKLYPSSHAPVGPQKPISGNGISVCWDSHLYVHGSSGEIL